MTADDAPRAGRREWIALAVLALPTLLMALDLSVLYLALPKLSADLKASSVQQLWITDSYGFMVAGFLVTMGTMGDRIGRRRLLLIGAAVFGVASVVAAFSTSPEMLIAARAALGIAGATLAPSTLALISTMFRDPKQMATAMAAWMACFVGGNAVGPLVGGVMLENFWWGSVFLLGVPVMVLLLVTGPVLLPEFRGSQAGKLDLLSVALSLLAILPVIYGLKETARNGWQPLSIGAIVVGVVLGVLFVIRQRRMSNPLLDLGLFANSSFSAVLTTMLVGGVFLGGTTLLITQFLQLVKGLSPLRAALWLLPAIAVMTIASFLAPVLARRVRPAYVMAAGMVIAAAGYGLLTQVRSVGGLAVLVIGWAVALGGGGLPAGVGMGLAIGSAPPEKAGSASSIQQTTTEFGLALGIAAVGSVGTAVYRSQMADAVPSSVPADIADAARDSLAVALSAAKQLPEVIASARSAYSTALNVAAGISAVAFFCLAILIVVVLRQVPAVGQTQVAAGGGPAGMPEADQAAAAAATQSADR
jgi:DHA2 family multidrug resistance protein-like MFS transporter